MYEKIVIILLLSGYISTEDDDSTHHELPSFISTEDSSPIPNTDQYPTQIIGRAGARGQIAHIFSGPVITGIVFAVMVGIIIIILSVVFIIRLLTKRPSLPPQSSSPENEDSEVP